MRWLRLAGMVVGSPAAMLGFLLPANGVSAGLGLVAGMLRVRGVVIIVG